MADQPNAYQQAIGVALNDAKSMLGKNEVPDRAEIMSYLHDGGQDLDPHKLAWCAAFVSASLTKAGLPVPTQVIKDSAFGPGAYAGNYLTYGSAINPKNIQAGDILVSNNGSHVGFAEGPIRNGPNGPEVQLLAGNERDPSGQYTPGSYTNPTTGAVANRSQVGMVGERWVPLSQYSARRYTPTDGQDAASSQPSQPPQGTTLNSSVIDTLSRNIASIETGNASNPYGIVQSRTGAVGKYQVMPFNVGPWTQQALGRSETPDQFRNDPAAQEAVFRDQATRALGTMSPQDFASTWFTGKPYSQATAGASDYTGTTNRNYVARATQGIPNAGTLVAGSTLNTTGGPSAGSQTASGGPQGAGGGQAGTPGTSSTGQPAGALPGFQGGSPADKMMQGAAKTLGLTNPYAGGGAGGDDQPRIDTGPPVPQAQAMGGAMMLGPGGQNTLPRQLAAQYMQRPSLAGLMPTQSAPQLTGQPLAAQTLMPAAQATGIPSMPGTTLNSPSQLQMALMTGALNPYDLYGSMSGGGFQRSS